MRREEPAQPLDAERTPPFASAAPGVWRFGVQVSSGSRRDNPVDPGSSVATVAAPALLSLAVFALLAWSVLAGETLALDRAVLESVRAMRTPALDVAAYTVTLLGSEALFGLVILLFLLLYRAGRWRAAGSLLLDVVGVCLLNNALKVLFQRARPDAVFALLQLDSWAFPSGHAMVSAGVYSFLAYLGWRCWHGRARVLPALVAGPLVLLVSLSRVYLGVHYLSDVIAGTAAGLFWTCCVILVDRLLDRRRNRPAWVRHGAARGARGRSTAQPGELD